MSASDFNDITSGIQNLIAALAIVAGGTWAWFKFVIYRERYPRVEFNLDLRVLGRIQGMIIVEVVALVENKGMVRLWLNDFKFDLLVLPDDKIPVDGDQRINHQVLFDKVIKNCYWIPPDWKKAFIDPGIHQEYTYVTHIPENSALAMIYAEFKYPDKESNFQPAQKAFRVAL